ncbi:hypothetical protein P691DRAFT_782561 [Macrolepiota fuliginosa MF-IS2]|uniref:Fe2OG dioxygenase domain-containing protein n=1 Tax=Macrolepiota fuliginosa MF-IS2 TaxID=1400762 RepID=A0A9P5XAX2_9AGAR|nr:hypothetical protein P691DRAFT_782561 [Macrolepiota fuliginosa MF-IS2]
MDRNVARGNMIRISAMSPDPVPRFFVGTEDRTTQLFNLHPWPCSGPDASLSDSLFVLYIMSDTIQKLRQILASQEKYHEPWASGVVTLSGSESTLFFKCRDNTARYIKFPSVNDADIMALLDACDPATFGRGPENVLDETYRKAWKLDEGNFSWRFNPDSGKFVGRLAQGLCPWDPMNKGIRAEPYKLNVYGATPHLGQGGFFKNHKDTPHAENMFGSLVFVLPIEHQGGSLLLRHRDREFKFDAPGLLKDSPPLSMAYVAFYSDVEHEVLEVTSGHRITITFNLYYDPSRAAPVLPGAKLKIPENTFTTVLRDYFRDAAFIRNHNHLGFGLEYAYPKRADKYDTWDHLPYLKGPDAFLYSVLSDLGLKPSLRYLYRSMYGGCKIWVMLTKVQPGRDRGKGSYNTELDYLLDEGSDAHIVWMDIPEDREEDSHPWMRVYESDKEYFDSKIISVDWVTQPSGNLTGRTQWVELGNEPAHEIYYYRVCIIVDANQAPCPPLLS